MPSLALTLVSVMLNSKNLSLDWMPDMYARACAEFALPAYFFTSAKLYDILIDLGLLLVSTLRSSGLLAAKSPTWI